MSLYKYIDSNGVEYELIPPTKEQIKLQKELEKTCRKSFVCLGCSFFSETTGIRPNTACVEAGDCNPVEDDRANLIWMKVK